MHTCDAARLFVLSAASETLLMLTVLLEQERRDEWRDSSHHLPFLSLVHAFPAGPELQASEVAPPAMNQRVCLLIQASIREENSPPPAPACAPAVACWFFWVQIWGSWFRVSCRAGPVCVCSAAVASSPRRKRQDDDQHGLPPQAALTAMMEGGGLRGSMLLPGGQPRPCPLLSAGPHL